MVVHHLLQFAWIIVHILNTDKKSATALEESPQCVFNDNYCDCGHDELVSSACSHHSRGRLFQCDDNQYFNQSLFLSRVGDGVCDCCDGSDEPHSNNLIFCPNVCAEIGLLLQLEVAATKDMKARGASERNAIIHDEEVKRRKMKVGYQKAKKAIAENRKVIKEYQLQLIGEEELESREFDRMSLLVESSFRQSLLRLSVEKIRRLLAVITLLIGDEGVESILLECDDMYEFDGPEPNDLSAFALVTASTCRAHIIEADKEASIQNTFSTGEIPPATIDSMITALSLNRLPLDSLIEVCQHAIPRALVVSISLAECFHHAGVTEHLESFPTSPASLKRADHRRLEADALRSQIRDLTSEVENIHDESKSSLTLSNTTYGPGNTLYSLRDSCFSHKHKEHDYEICLFKDVKQGSILIGTYDKVVLEASPTPSLGRADGIQLHDSQDNRSKISFYFTGGALCYGTGRPREMILTLECSTGDAYIHEVDEIEICSYRAILRTPLACY